MKKIVAFGLAAMAAGALALTTGVELKDGANAVPSPSVAVAAQAVSTNAAGTAKVVLKKVTPAYAGGVIAKAWTNKVWDATLTGGICTNAFSCRFMPGDFLVCETQNAPACRVTVVLEN